MDFFELVCVSVLGEGEFTFNFREGKVEEFAPFSEGLFYYCLRSLLIREVTLKGGW